MIAYEAHLSKRMQRALAELERLQARRAAAERPPATPALANGAAKPKLLALKDHRAGQNLNGSMFDLAARMTGLLNAKSLLASFSDSRR